MTFQPVVPFNGNLGWAFLQRTRETQEAAFTESAVVQRDTDYFRDNIGSITNAEELVADPRLLKVALGAFGLDDDLPNKAFIQKVLDEGTLADDAFANKLADKRYAAMAEAFGFDLAPSNISISTFPEEIISAYEIRQFEVAVGNSNENMRLALGLGRELETISAGSISEDGLWFTIMGTPPLRAVFEAAFNLPTSFGTLDVDRQLEVFKEKAAANFGDSSVRQFTDPDKQEELLRKFFVSSELNLQSASAVRGSVALSLLQSSVSPF
ncbi:MAG: DUF1217 domain-containing protein [Pseudomonadota bacterium]